MLCAQLAVLSVRNANIVSEGKASELGVLNFELGIILGFAYDFELFSCELEDVVLFLVFSVVGARPYIIISEYLVIIIWDANIVQRVKTCYKIKIDYRDFQSCFSRILKRLTNQYILIEPLLQSDSAIIRV